MGFYLLARAIAAVQLIGNDPLSTHTTSQQVIGFVVNCLSAVLPHLDEFTRTDWLVYQNGTWASLAVLLLQGAICLTLLGAAALFDLYRKNI